MTEVVYGIHAVKALLDFHPRRIEKILVQTPVTNSRLQPLITQAKQQQIALTQCDKNAFNKALSTPARHQGILAYYQPLVLLGENDLLQAVTQLEQAPLVLILDAIQDPHNFGACLRSAAAAGVDAVIFPKDKSVKLTATVHHVSAGASLQLALYQITNLARVMRALQEAGVWIYGADASTSQTLYDCDFSGPSALVMGTEGEGMRQLTKKHCDYLIKIPMTDTVESLNVSVATGICLFEMVRQRRN